MPELRTNLVYDVGMHQGEDTAFYLKKGYDVVAFEANPELIEHCRNRFAAEIRAGRLRIVEGAIAPPTVGPMVRFFVNDLSVWGTIEEGWVRRNEQMGHRSVEIMAPRIDIGEAFGRYGMPYYLKVDIEGADRVVIEELRNWPQRPRHVSIESDKTAFSRVEDELRLLGHLGYTRFSVVQQRTIPGSRIRTRALDGAFFEHIFESDSSGPFGEDLDHPRLDLEGASRRYRRIFQAYRWLGDGAPLPGRILRRLLRQATGYSVGWYDTHASAH